MGKNIQLPTRVVIDVYSLLLALENYKLDYDTDEIIERLKTAINAKVQAMEKRQAYTQYKMASSAESKEDARQKYLDLAGIHADWRWCAEDERKRQKGEII